MRGQWREEEACSGGLREEASSGGGGDRKEEAWCGGAGQRRKEEAFSEGASHVEEAWYKETGKRGAGGQRERGKCMMRGEGWTGKRHVWRVRTGERRMHGVGGGVDRGKDGVVEGNDH